MSLQTSTVDGTKQPTRSKLREQRFSTYSLDTLQQVECGYSTLRWMVTSRSQSGNRKTGSGGSYTTPNPVPKGPTFFSKSPTSQKFHNILNHWHQLRISSNTWTYRQHFTSKPQGETVSLTGDKESHILIQIVSGFSCKLLFIVTSILGWPPTHCEPPEWWDYRCEVHMFCAVLRMKPGLCAC